MANTKRKICIFGTGGFGREVLNCVVDMSAKGNKDINDIACFMVDDQFLAETSILGVDVIPRSRFNPDGYDVVVAVANPQARKTIVEQFPAETTFATLVHPTAILSDSVHVGEGSIITAGVVLTCNITIGKHAHLNLYTTIGHDCIIGDYFTTAPAVNISGNCRFGSGVYFGTNAAIREGIALCDDVTIGMGGIVLKSIAISGVYVGNPVRKINSATP